MFQYQAFQTGQATITGTATPIVPAFPSRSGIMIENAGSVDVYIGENANVTTSTGHLLNGSKGTSISFATTGAVWGITGGSSATITWIQTN